MSQVYKVWVAVGRKYIFQLSMKVILAATGNRICTDQLASCCLRRDRRQLSDLATHPFSRATASQQSATNLICLVYEYRYIKLRPPPTPQWHPSRTMISKRVKNFKTLPGGGGGGRREKCSKNSDHKFSTLPSRFCLNSDHQHSHEGKIRSMHSQQSPPQL